MYNTIEYNKFLKSINHKNIYLHTGELRGKIIGVYFDDNINRYMITYYNIQEQKNCVISANSLYEYIKKL